MMVQLCVREVGRGTIAQANLDLNYLIAGHMNTHVLHMFHAASIHIVSDSNTDCKDCNLKLRCVNQSMRWNE